jgi:hypothetical protein
VQQNAGAFKSLCRNVTVNHSAEDKVEQATHVLLEGILKMRNHEYVSDFVVANCRYDVLLGMPWHVAQDPKVSYSEREVHVKDGKIPVDMGYSLGSKPKVQSMSVKSFRRDLRTMNTRNDIKVFKLVEVSNMGYSLNDKQRTDPRMEHILKKYNDFFRSELPNGLPPKRSGDLSIETEPGAKPPHRTLYQLSPAELHAAK